MNLSEITNQTDTRWKQIICQKHGIPQTAVAKHLGYTYHHTRMILRGISTPKPATAALLDALVTELEGTPL